MGLFDWISDGLGTSNKFSAQPRANVFRAQQAGLDESQYGSGVQQAQDAALAGTGPNAAAGGQAALAEALKAQMEGRGPSLAQRQLETATQANAAQAAGALAGAKGINPALAARMISQNQAAGNQAAAGQSATLRQSEQLNTEGLLAQALAAQRGQDISQQGANTQLLSTTGQLQQGQNANRIQNNQGTNQINAQVGEGNANRALGADQINAGVSAQNANTNAGLVGGLLQGAGSAAAAFAAADGGEVPTHADFLAALKVHRYASGGSVDIPQLSIPDYSRTLSEGGDALKSGLSGAGKALGGRKASPGGGTPTDATNGSPLAAYSPQGAPTVAPWEGASPLLTTGNPYAPSMDPLAGMGDLAPVAAAAHGGAIPRDFRAGGKVPGRAQVQGDSPRNDTVPAVVSPGEVVLPRSVTQAPDAEAKAAQFVAAIKAKRAPEHGYGAVLASHRALAQRLARLEKMAEGGEVQDPKPPPKKDEDEHAPGWHIADAINAALPDWLSGRSAVMAQRERQRKAEAAAGAQ